jgi:protein-tyrosine phosphatase
MIDIHAHILHGVDDGSRSIEESLKMISDCKAQGVDKIILTPHLRGSFNHNGETLKKRFDELKSAVEDSDQRVELYLGREVRIDKHFKETLTRGKECLMVDTDYLLAEFDFFESTDIADAVYEIKRLGYKVIVAHFERYSYATIEDAYAVKDEGGLIQINADSLFGKAGLKAKKTANALIKLGLCDFVSSDIHFNRVNLMAKAYKKVEKKYGEEIAQKLFNLNAIKILKRD